MSEVKRVKIDFSGLQGTVKCARCASASTDICNQLGCGFLESGNGESEIDQLRQRAEKAEAERDEKQAASEMFYQKQILAETRQKNAERKLAHAEQKISELVAAFTPLIKNWDDLATGESVNVDRARKALNQNSEGN